jgi:CRISPR system Cascade subunit CasA
VAYNLIDERWIPVERRSGKVELIAPAQVAERDDPPLRIASPRPDFDGALLEFLVGLLQTAAAPRTEHEWESQFETPPTVAVLKKRLDTVREAFFLDGDGPRFMQEVTLNSDDAKSKAIGYLLINRAGEDNVGEGPSLFIKPGEVPALSNAAAAAALFAMQSRAPSGGGGGGGHFTSVRGGSALSTVVLGGDLWETVWLNLIPSSLFAPDEAVTGPSARIFPWMGKIRSGNKKTGLPTSASEVHPGHAYWALPRRVLLTEWSADQKCSVLADVGAGAWVSLLTATAGMRYEGLLHPLAAYARKSESDPWLPFLTPEAGFTYRDWPSVTQATKLHRAPRIVAYIASTRRLDKIRSSRLLVFGYAMESMKPLRWCRAETPIISVAQGLEGYFAEATEGLVAVSDEVRRTLSSQVRAAWSDRPAELDVFAQVNPAFWSATEAAFFTAVQAVKAGLESHSDEQRDTAKEAWLDALHRAALGLFDRFVDASTDLAAPDLRRAVVARRALEQFTRPSSPKLRKLLVLLVDAVNDPGKPAKPRTKKKESTP